jgi:hypothetical protein
MKTMTVKIILVSMAFVTMLALTTGAHRPEPEAIEIGGYTLHTLMDPGVIPAIFDPQFVSIAAADSFYYDSEPLMVVVAGDDVRGY